MPPPASDVGYPARELARGGTDAAEFFGMTSGSRARGGAASRGDFRWSLLCDDAARR